MGYDTKTLKHFISLYYTNNLMPKSTILTQHPAPNKHPRWAEAIHTATLITFLAASSAPTPLYRLYQQAWHFTPVTLTFIFGAYALALLTALICAGSLSDHIGRRPVITLALVLEIGAMGLFLGATGSGGLILARILQGLATGLAATSVGAALLDLNRERGALTNSIAPMSGMALGALGTSALIQFAMAPLHLVYVLLLAAFIIETILTWRTPETAANRPGALASLRPNIIVPAQTRAAFLAVTPINVAIWMLGGFYLSLMPSLIAKVTLSTSTWIGSIAVAALTLSGTLAVIVARNKPAFSALFGGVFSLGLGVLAIVIGANRGLTTVLLAGSVITGIGFGAGFLGAIRTILPLAKPTERAGLMAAFYVECYLANSLPAMLAGYLVQHLGLLNTSNLYGATIIVLVVAATLLLLRYKRQTLEQLTPCISI